MEVDLSKVDAAGEWAGMAIELTEIKDLSKYNALTFYMRGTGALELVKIENGASTPDKKETSVYLEHDPNGSADPKE